MPHPTNILGNLTHCRLYILYEPLAWLSMERKRFTQPPAKPTPDKLEELLSILSTLNQTQLTKVQIRVNHYLSRISLRKESTTEEDMMYTAFASMLHSTLGVVQPPYWTFKRSSNYTLFKSNITILLNYTDSSLYQATRLERLQVYHLYATLLKNFLTDARISLSITTVVRTMPHIPELVEQAFPGYVESGLLRHILKRVQT